MHKRWRSRRQRPPAWPECTLSRKNLFREQLDILARKGDVIPTPLEGIDAGRGYGESLGDTLSSLGDKMGAVGDVDVGEAAIAIAVVVLVAAILFSSLFMVYSAPLLLAELLVDGVLAASL